MPLSKYIAKGVKEIARKGRGSQKARGKKKSRAVAASTARTARKLSKPILKDLGLSRSQADALGRKIAAMHPGKMKSSSTRSPRRK